MAGVFTKAWSKLTGQAARDRRAAAQAILDEHEGRDHFGVEEAFARVAEILGHDEAEILVVGYVTERVSHAVLEVLADKLLEPHEERQIASVLARYDNPQLDDDARLTLERARNLYDAFTSPLEEVASPLMLKPGEYCVHGLEAEAFEERSRTVRVNYGGPSARIRIAKGLYYSAGSMAVERQQQQFHHSFGVGVLAATNKRLLWVSPGKTIAVPLSRIVLFEPFADGIKIIKDAGKPVIFTWSNDGAAGSTRIGRVIEELR